MNRLQTVVTAGALMLAATAADAHGGAAAGGAGSGAGATPTPVQSQGYAALAAREGFGLYAQSRDLGLIEYTHPRPALPEWRLKKLEAFRTEALQRQEADGGTLSESDRLYLRAKLSRILVP